MFYILDIPGHEIDNACILGEDGVSYSFETEKEAIDFADENCAWDYIIVEY